MNNFSIVQNKNIIRISIIDISSFIYNLKVKIIQLYINEEISIIDIRMIFLF